MNKIDNVFVLGIGCSGMSSIAKYLAQKGMKVEGYDQRKSYITNQLEQDGVKVYFDGYDGDKPMTTREVIGKDKDKDLEISDYLSEREEIVKIIKLIGDSLGVPVEDNDNYAILLSYDLLDLNTLADIRYGLQKVSESDIHPRANKEMSHLKKLERKP